MAKRRSISSWVNKKSSSHRVKQKKEKDKASLPKTRQIQRNFKSRCSSTMTEMSILWHSSRMSTSMTIRSRALDRAKIRKVQRVLSNKHRISLMKSSRSKPRRARFLQNRFHRLRNTVYFCELKSSSPSPLFKPWTLLHLSPISTNWSRRTSS